MGQIWAPMLSSVASDAQFDGEKQLEEGIIDFPFIEPAYLEMDLSGLEISQEHEQLLSTFEYRDETNKDVLKYIAGYVAYRFKNKFDLGTETHKLSRDESIPDWINFVSKGNLLQPNNALLEATSILDKEFHEFHGNSLSSEPYIFRKLAEKTAAKLANEIPFEVLLCLSRTRTYIRLRDLNRKISYENCKRKMNRKVLKFVK